MVIFLSNRSRLTRITSVLLCVKEESVWRHHSHMKPLITLLCIWSVAVCSIAADKAAKPKLGVAADGFPSGHDLPEGVARAFIKRDVSLFTNVCLRPFEGGEARTNYQEFLEGTIHDMKQEATQKEASPGGPKAISKVFAARHLSRNGPASFDYAMFNFHDVMFVDVEALLHNGKRALNRTLVVKKSDDRWFVHPAPNIHPLLSAGLNEESDSTQEFSDAHEIAPDDVLRRKDAEQALARIQPGMTLKDVRRAFPHTSEDVLLVSHGGMMMAFRLSPRYSIVVRFVHPPTGRPDAHLIADTSKYVQYYEPSLVNHSPTLNEDGRAVSPPGKPW
jgi:hypothetical protein